MIRGPFGKTTVAKHLEGSEHDLRPMRRNSRSGSSPACTSPEPSPSKGLLSSPFKKKKESVSKLWQSKGNLVFGPKDSEKTTSTVDDARQSAVDKFAARVGSPRQRRRASLTHVQSPAPQTPKRTKSWRAKKPDKITESARSSASHKFRRASLSHVSSPSLRNHSTIQTAPGSPPELPKMSRQRRASLSHVHSPPSVTSPSQRIQVANQATNSPNTLNKSAASIWSVLKTPVQRRRASLTHIQSPASPVSPQGQEHTTQCDPPRPATGSPVQSRSINGTKAPQTPGQYTRTSNAQLPAPNTCPSRTSGVLTTRAVQKLKTTAPFAEDSKESEKPETPKKKKKVIVRRVIIKRRIKKSKGNDDVAQSNVDDCDKNVVVSRRIISSQELDTAATQTPKRVVRHVKNSQTPGNAASSAVVSPSTRSIARTQPSAGSPPSHVQQREKKSKYQVDPTTSPQRETKIMAATGSPLYSKTLLPSSPTHLPAGGSSSPTAKQVTTGAAERNNSPKLKKRIVVKRVTQQWPKTPSMSLSPTKVSQEVNTEKLINKTEGLLLLDEPQEEDTEKLEGKVEGKATMATDHEENEQDESEELPPKTNHSRLYEYARRCNWDKVSEECKLFPRDAKCVGEKDGTTALHLAVMSRSNPSLRDGTMGILRPAPLSLVEQLVIACPEAAIIRCTIKRYTPLVYACLVVDRGYNMKDASETVAILLHHAPHSAYVFTDEGFSALDVHILSYSRFYKEREEVFTGGHTSTLVLQALLTERPDLAEARMYKNKVRGPIELLYRSNLEEFKDIGSGDGKLLERIGYLSSQSDWWAWKWVALLLKHAPRRSKRTNQVGPFTALHAAASLVGCPLPVLSIAANTYPKQLAEADPRGLLGNLPLHEVCSWVSDAEIVCGDQFIQRRKALAIQCLMEEYPEAACVCNGMGETPLLLAIESCTPWDDGLDILVEAYPEALEIPRSLRECSDDNEFLLSRAFSYDDNDSVDSDWVDPLEAVDGMYPFMVAAVLSHVPDSKVNPSSFVFCDRSPEKRKDDLEKKELESLRTIYGLLRTNPRVLSMYKPINNSNQESLNEGSDDSSNFTEVTCEDEEVVEEEVRVSDEESTVEPLVARADARSL